MSGITELVVTRKELVADGVVALTLTRPDAGPLPAWSPGAHIDLLLGPGLERQYSLCGDPGDTSAFQVAVLREPAGRGGSAYVHEELAEGATVRARGPRNRFALAEADSYLFIAGGIGITPLLPMLDEADRRGAQWRLVYGGRTRRSMAFATWLAARWPGRVELHPEDEYGQLALDALLGDARSGAGPGPGTAVYCCGPPPLLDAVGERCAHRPPGTLHTERFAPAAGGAAGAAGEAGGALGEGGRAADDVPFEVELALSGRVLTVAAECSVLETVEKAGIEVLSSCREGTCGTCETGVLDGVPEHRDSLLTAEERAAGDVMFICVSRCRSGRLVLEL